MAAIPGLFCGEVPQAEAGDESDAIGMGDPLLCPPEAETDRYGLNRLERGNIDIGAYTWQPTETGEQ